MRRGNSEGSVYKLGGKRRRPWIAIITSGWNIDTEKGTTRQERQVLGYFKSRPDAENALNAFLKNPYDLDTYYLTFSQVYDMWFEEHDKELTNKSASRSYKAAFNYCKPIHNMRFRDIRVSHMQGVIRDCSAGDTTKQRMKSLFNQMYRYALTYEITGTNYAALFSVAAARPKIERVPFSNAQIAELWKYEKSPTHDIILFNIYMGFRPSETLQIRTKDVNIEKRIITGGMKTDAGRDRTVPIPDKIMHIVEEHYDPAAPYLFMNERFEAFTYDQYRGRFNSAMRLHGWKHKPHDTRHTWTTCAKHFKIPDGVICDIIGHEPQTVSEKVYTHRPMRELREYMNMINYEWDDSDE